MAKKGIEEMISEIEIFVDNCKYQTLSTTKIIVPKEDLSQMLSELKMKLPNEIERCKKIMRNKEAILADARQRADSIITESVAEANRLVDQNQIVELANIRANEILDMARQQAEQIVAEATNEATEVRLGAMQYTGDKLAEVSGYINATLEAEKANYENLIASLQSNLEIMVSNAQEINLSIASLTGAAAPESAPAPAPVADDEDDYNVYNDESSEEDDDEDFDEFLDD